MLTLLLFYWWRTNTPQQTLMIVEGNRSDITNLSLQDEQTRSYATYFEALEAVSKTSQVVRTSSAYSNLKPHEEDPSLIYVPQKRNFKFQLRVHLI